VGVDLPQGKNLVGAFHAPRLVVADTATLSTLPARHRWNGLAEVAKVALIGDLTLLRALERDLEALGRGDADPTGVTERAARFKARVVSGDDLEGGQRMILNFGHTLGHALEAGTGYGPLLHGEAVVVGMRAAVELSLPRGLPQLERMRAVLLLKRFPLPGALPRPNRRAVTQAMLRDKKGPRFIVLRKLGQAEVTQAISQAELRGVINFGLHALADAR
jgi:3-dehydroquinate synthase